MDQKLIELLEKLSDKLGTTSELLYKTMVKQVKLNAIIEMIQFVCLWPLLPLLLWFWRLILPHCVGHEWPAEIQILVAFLGIGSLAWAIGIFAMFFNIIQQGITALKNPEGAALESILHSLKQ